MDCLSRSITTAVCFGTLWATYAPSFFASKVALLAHQCPSLRGYIELTIGPHEVNLGNQSLVTRATTNRFDQFIGARRMT